MYGNGAGSLVSLTFDDGLPCQIANALPMLNRWGLDGTFFLIAADASEYGPLQKEVWRDAYGYGHEIGSHTVTHRKPFTLSTADAVWEARRSKGYLENMINGMVTTFCYPFTDAPAALQDAVRGCGYVAARGGRGARPDKYLVPGDGANLFNVPCFHVGPQTIVDCQQWIDETVRRGAWLTLMFHGVGDPQAWDNISVLWFDELLSYLYAAKSRGLQVVTFSQGAGLYRQGNK